jgi:hypothetical protein
MNSRELVIRLKREGFSPRAYHIETLGGQRGDDCLCLRDTGGSWDVYYVERGQETILEQFVTEAEACAHLLARLEREPHSRSHLLASFSDTRAADRLAEVLALAGIRITHRDAPAFASKTDIRYRIFVDGRDLERASALRDELPTGQAG